MVERLNGIEEVSGSNPLGSTVWSLGDSTALRDPRKKPNPAKPISP